MSKQEWQEEFEILPQGCPHCNGGVEDGESQDESEQNNDQAN